MDSAGFTIEDAPASQSQFTIEDAPQKQQSRTWLDEAKDAAQGIWEKVNPVSGIKGAAQLAAHPIDTYTADAANRTDIINKAEAAFKKGNYAEGMAHALNGIIPFLGPQMEEAGENIQQGQVAKGVGQSVGLGLNLSAPAVVRGAGAAALKAIPTSAADALAERMYQSALKPPPGSYSTAQVSQFNKTGLANDIPISESGMANLQNLVGELNSRVKAQIQAGSNAGATVNKFDVTSRLANTAKRFATQANPEADLNAISSSGNEFLRNQPTEIPASVAQDIKSGTYSQLSSKAYGELSTATQEAQKALARGIKEELQQQFPEIQGLNAAEGKLLDLQPALERAVRRINNHDLLSLGGKVLSGAAGSVVGAATGSAEGAALGGAGALALHYVMTDPFVQSKLAIQISRASKGVVPIGAAQAKVAAYVNALGNAVQQPAGQPVSNSQ